MSAEIVEDQFAMLAGRQKGGKRQHKATANFSYQLSDRGLMRECYRCDGKGIVNHDR